MMSGVASNMVAFVGKEKTSVKRPRPESMEIDQQPGGQRPRIEYENLDSSSHEQGMADLHISASNCGDTVTHTSNNWDDAT